MSQSDWQKIIQVRKFAAANGYNVALYHAEHSLTYKSFEKKVRDGLYSQIASIADYKSHLPILMTLAKSASVPLLQQVSALVSKVTLNDKIPLTEYLTWAGGQGGQAQLDQLGIYGVFGLKNPAFIKYFDNYHNLLIKSVDDYTKKWIAQTIQAGKDQGMTPFEVQKLLLDDGKEITKIRAERIVLTETSKAMNLVGDEAAVKYGITEQIWRTSQDERTCPICLPMEGEQRRIGEEFSAGVTAPPAHVSCRCDKEDVIPDNWIAPTNPWLGE